MTTELQADIQIALTTAFAVRAQFSVRAGETVALLGPNGAGKSTIVSALAGLRALNAGVIAYGSRVFDAPAAGRFVPAAERRVGVVFQDALLFPHMNVLHNIEFGPTSMGRDRGHTRDQVHVLVNRFGLASLLERKPSQLSGGEAQRVAIVRTLVTEPEVLVLDEPFAAIDASARPQLRRDLTHFLETFAGPAIVITHDPTEAFLMADRILILENGAITHDGTPDDIRLTPRTAYAADLAGVNLLSGIAGHGVITIAGHALHVADTSVHGPTTAVIHPRAIALHTDRPHGSARNVWQTTVARVESLGETVRLATGNPCPLIAEVTRQGASDIGAAPGTAIWVSIKATEIRTTPTGTSVAPDPALQSL